MIWGLLFLFLVWAAMLLFGTSDLDRALLNAVYVGDRPGLAAAARWLTEAGGWPVLLTATAIGALLLIARRDWRGAGLLLGITLSGRILVWLQKMAAARVRPDVHDHLVDVTSLSFPSGHSANSLMVWLCLALLVPRTAAARRAAVAAAAILILAVGLSRNLLSVHWPSDVVGGWALGLFWTFLLLRLSGHAPRLRPSSPTLHSPPREGGSE